MEDQKLARKRELSLDSSVLGKAMNCLDRLKRRLPDQIDKLQETSLYLREIRDLIRSEGHLGYVIKPKVIKTEVIKPKVKEAKKEEVIEELMEELTPPEEPIPEAIKEPVKEEVIEPIEPEILPEEIERLVKIEKLKAQLEELNKEEVK